MRKVEIFVQGRIIRVEYRQENLQKVIEWEDKHDLSRSFLLRLDKINKCDKNSSNCLFKKGKSESATKPTTVVLHQEGRESTTFRIIYITLKALEWAKKIRLTRK